MKPTSVIFLVISVMLIVGGMITCSIARDVALTDNYTLFVGSSAEDSFVRHDFSAADISKIELLVSDADIYIYGGAEESYIEFSGFREGLYTLTSSGKVLSLDEMPDIKSILSLKGGFSFSGMRYFLRRDDAEETVRRIHIYLTQEAALKILTIEADNCTLHTDALYSQFDVTLRASESARAEISAFRTACSLTLEGKHVEADIRGSYLHALTVDAGHAEIKTSEIYFDNLSVKAKSGSADIHSIVGLNGYEFDVRGEGSLTLNSTDIPLPHVAVPAGNIAGKITAELDDAVLSLVEMVD